MIKRFFINWLIVIALIAIVSGVLLGMMKLGSLMIKLTNGNVPLALLPLILIVSIVAAAFTCIPK